MLQRWILTCGGAGLVKGIPGTAGSLLTALVLLGAYYLIQHFEPGLLGWLWPALLVVGLLKTSALCVALGPWAGAHWGRKDPGPVVIDEAAGICLSLLLVPASAAGMWLSILIGFLAFRLFDIWKPWPARRLEKLPMGWGILMDDLMAGVYANLLCQVLVRGVFAG